MATKFEIQYRAKINNLLKDVNKLKKNSILQTRNILQDSLKRTLQQLQNTVPGEWNAFNLSILKQTTVSALKTLQNDYNSLMRITNAKSWDLGVNFVNDIIKVSDLNVFIPSIDISALRIAQIGTADLIKNVSQQVINNVNVQIQLGIMGEKTSFQIMQDMGGSLTSPGVFKTIAVRAETITRTEISRVQNIATQARLNQFGEEIPEMQKQWLWSGVSRVTHAAAHGQVVDFDESFIVGGEKLRFPLDPRGTAGNTINCGCTVVPFMPDWPPLDELLPDVQAEADELVRK